LATWVWVGVLLAAYTGVTLWYGTVRPIDGDEGFYAMAARLVSEGRHLYRDFFYPQGPLLPYVYAPVVAVVGPSLRALRVVSALLSVLMVVPWLLMLARLQRGRIWWLLGSAGLLLLDPHLLIWNSTVKTFALCNLTASWGLYFLWRGLGGGRWVWFAATGLALGLAASARALYLPLPAVVLLALTVMALRGGGRSGWLAAAACAGGVVVASLPAVAYLLADPDRFIFNNLTCHRIRFSELRSLGLGDSFSHRSAAALTNLFQALILNPYRGLLLLLTVLGWTRLFRRDAPDRAFQIIAAAASLAFLGLNLLPDPVQHQYLTPTLGVLMLPAAVAGYTWCGRVFSGWGLKIVPVLAVVLSLLTLWVWRPGVSDKPDWTWDVYDRVCANLEAVTEPGDLVYSFWSGYVFETGTVPLTGSENHFAVGVSEELTPAEKTRYKVVGKELLSDVFATRRARAVVVGAWMNEINHALDDQQMTVLLGVFTDHYCPVSSEGDISVCLPCDPRTGGILTP